MTQKVEVIYRRMPVPSDRRPRRIMASDYDAFLPYEPANYGCLACIGSVLGESDTVTPSYTEADLGFYRTTKKVHIDDVPKALRDYIRWNPDGPEFVEVVRHRLNHDRLRQEAWSRS